MVTRAKPRKKAAAAKLRPIDDSTSDKLREKQNETLKSRNIEVTAETFRTTMRGRWYLKFRGFARPTLKPKYDLNLIEFNGDVIDLGNKSWIVAGNAIGNRTDGAALNLPFNIEYMAETDTLLWNIVELKAVIVGVSLADSPVQMKADVAIPKIVLVIRRLVAFDPRYWMPESSYLTI